MQFANVMLALGGDMNNTVPKYNVSASEIAVLRAIHGDGAIYDVEPTYEKAIAPRDELSRLRGLYGRAMGRENKPIINDLFPGAAARLFDTIDELGLVPEQFKAEVRVKPQPKAEAKPAAPAEEKVIPNTLTRDEIADHLKALGVDFPPRATKSQLVTLLEQETARLKAAHADEAAADEEADLDDFNADENVLD